MSILAKVVLYLRNIFAHKSKSMLTTQYHSQSGLYLLIRTQVYSTYLSQSGFAGGHSPVLLFFVSPCKHQHTTQSQSHGKIVRKLSKRLKVGSRARMHPHPHSSDHAEFVPVRPSSPVLMSSNPIPLHMTSLMEEDGESVSSQGSSREFVAHKLLRPLLGKFIEGRPYLRGKFELGKILWDITMWPC